MRRQCDAVRSWRRVSDVADGEGSSGRKSDGDVVMTRTPSGSSAVPRRASSELRGPLPLLFLLSLGGAGVVPLGESSGGGLALWGDERAPERGCYRRERAPPHALVELARASMRYELQLEDALLAVLAAVPRALGHIAGGQGLALQLRGG